MTTLIFTHPDFRLHDTGMGHPEARPGSIPFGTCSVSAISASWSSGRLRKPRSSNWPLSISARMSMRCWRRCRSKGEFIWTLIPSFRPRPGPPFCGLGVFAAVDAVLGGEGVDNAFCAVRPCGHHAEPARAMGFCVFNNIAVGAEHARRQHGAEKVAIVDFDVHHGNGTQAMVEDEPDLFFASTHEWPFYPGTGARDERGNHDNVVNVPLAAFAGSAEFDAA